MKLLQYELLVDNDVGRYYLSEKQVLYEGTVRKLTKPRQVVDLVVKLFKMRQLAEEHVYMVAVDNKNSPLGIFFISKGTVNSTLLTTREILVRALLVGATGLFVVHNHPSGESLPSSADIKTTRSLEDGCKLVGLRLVDHIIIGNHDYYSIKTEVLANESV